MDFIRINRSELVRNVKTKSALLENIARSNALNHTGKLNYNAGGYKDGIGLESVTEKFVDNFLIRVLVADYNIKYGKTIFVRLQNKAIRDLLDAYRQPGRVRTLLSMFSYLSWALLTQLK